MVCSESNGAASAPPFFKPCIMKSVFVSLALALSITSLSGATPYTYLDAAASNTTLNGTPIVVGSVLGTNGTNVTDNANASNSDGAWALRLVTDFEKGNYFETDAGTASSDSETTPDLITTVTPGAAGTYEMVVVFSKTSKRDIAAKIASSPSANVADGDIFFAGNSLDADQASANPQIIFDSSFANGRGSLTGAGYLGEITTTSVNQAISIYVNGYDSGTGTNQRTQYEGIGYRLVTPQQPVHRDVFIIAGQSNADGRGTVSELTGPLATYAATQPEVLIHYTNPAFGGSQDPLYENWVPLRPGFSVAPGSSGALPRVSFGMEVSASTILAAKYDHPAIIKVTRGGTSLGRPGIDWYPAELDSADAGPLYTALIQSTKAALLKFTDAGDTYTVHSMFWHQGESDASREASYGALLTELARSVRRDLEMPNLRFIVGELAPGKPQSFRDVQWNTSRALRNGGFVSSRNLTTSDENTHFDTGSVIAYGQRLGEFFTESGRVITFEQPSYTLGEIDRQNGFSSPPGIEIQTTATSGEHPGGQAVGSLSGGERFNIERKGLLPLSGSRQMVADVFPAQANSSLTVAAWSAETNINGRYDIAETALGMGVNTEGFFQIRIGADLFTSEGFPYLAGRWYRLTADWTAPAADGTSQITLRVRDLTLATNLNGGLSVAGGSTIITDPASWLGTGLSAEDGLIDNLSVEAPGYLGWLGNRYPTLPINPALDSDGDGITNGFEYALGVNPTIANTAPAPKLEAGNLTLTFPEIESVMDSFIEVFSSTDLTNWTSVPRQNIPGFSKHSVPTANEPKQFLRSRVTYSR